MESYKFEYDLTNQPLILSKIILDYENLDNLMKHIKTKNKLTYYSLILTNNVLNMLATIKNNNGYIYCERSYRLDKNETECYIRELSKTFSYKSIFCHLIEIKNEHCFDYISCQKYSDIVIHTDTGILYNNDFYNVLFKNEYNLIFMIKHDTDVEYIKYINELWRVHCLRCDKTKNIFDNQTIKYAVINGNYECLRYFHDIGCELCDNLCSIAAYHNRINCLIYLHDIGCKWDSTTCASAAKSGSLRCLQYAFEFGCPCDKSACAYAAEFGHLKCLQYMHENKVPWDYMTTLLSEKNNHTDCYNYAVKNGCKVRKMTNNMSLDTDCTNWNIC